MTFDPLASIVQWLRGSAALQAIVGERIYGDELPRGATVPALVVVAINPVYASMSPTAEVSFETRSYAARAVSGPDGAGAMEVDAAAKSRLDSARDLNVCDIAWAQQTRGAVVENDPDWPDWKMAVAQWDALVVNQT